MYNQEELANYDIDEYRYLFAVGRVLNVFDNSSGAINYLPKEIERPVLLVNFKIDFFEEYYRTLLDGDGSLMYFIAAPNGRIVSASGEQSEALAKRSDWVMEAVNGGSGIVQVKDRGDAMIVSYDTSQITGWTLISAVRSKDLIPQVSGNIFMMVAKLGAVVLALSLILAYSMSMLVTKPLNHLMKAIRKTGQGYFATRVPVRGYGEFEKLGRRFNEMNDKIQQLIHENYEVKLLEKQSQINLLNTQLNPHFLYNTLNLVNCIAIEHHNREISRIVASLSRMLHYTVENNKSFGALQEELDWLESYIYIMRCRFEGGLDYGCYVEPELLRGEVPRLFLQPFVENAFIHGFEELEEGRVLRISGWIEEGHRYFSVRDNGKGMSSERIEQVMSGIGSSVGMRNVHQRLKLMYGEQYGITIQSNPGSGTVIMICLPGESDAAPTDLQ
jgi:two-component system, sensor histidine kinase YesM